MELDEYSCIASVARDFTGTLSQLDRPSLPSMSTNMNLLLAISLDCENASSRARICLARAPTDEAEAEAAQEEQRRIWRRRRERGDEKLLFHAFD